MQRTALQPNRISFRWPLLTVLILFIIELWFILRINHMFFTFLFDDAYLHFDQAANILSGTYGHNPAETSAACSSILWPFFLAPFTLLPGFEWVVLALNLALVIAIIRIQYLIIAPLFFQFPEDLRDRGGRLLTYLLLLGMILIPNLILLLFSGMETPLQIFFIHLILLGLIREHQTGRSSSYLIIGLLFAPLVRYESLAIVCPAMIYLYKRGHRTEMMLTGVAVILGLALFSLFLYVHGLGLLPTSITARNIHQNGLRDPVSNILVNLFLNLVNPFSLPLLLLIAMLLPAIIAGRYRNFRGLAAVLISGGLLHLIFGHIGPLPLTRYEAYIVSALAIGAVYIYFPHIYGRYHGKSTAVIIPLLPFCLLCLPPAVTTSLIPAISNTTYRHPYQMHRMVTEFYPYPAGVNDIGWVTYKNDNYVLDLWGASSRASLQCGLQRNSLDCIDHLARQKHIRLVMITGSWFRNVPDRWIRIGAFHPGRNPRLLAPFVRGIVNHVDFYVTDRQYLEEALAAANDFRRSLPSTASFIFSPETARYL